MRSQGRAVLLGVSLAAAAVTSCVFLPRHAVQPRVAFPHRVHVEQKLACTDCHAQDDATGSIGHTSPDVCRICHERQEDPLLHAERVLPPLYDESGAPRGPFFLALDEELVFDHAAHARYVPCEACHAEVIEGSDIGPDMALRKPACMDCHTRMAAPNDCSTCHQRTRRDTRPESHDRNWLREHGLVAESERSRCALCHLEKGGVASCTGCHLTVPPRSHTEAFKRRSHGLLATMDRSACQTCHTTDFCTACHQGVRPTSHRGSFGSPQNNHCLTCHFPLSSEPSCRVCHLATPSHSTGASQPPGHVAGANCRACHGFGARLPHADDGSACQSCHPL